MQAYLSPASFAFYRLNGYKHFPEYFFNFVRFYVIIHQKDGFKALEYIQMSLLLRVRGFYLLNKQEKKLSQDCLDCWDRSFSISCGPQRKRFHHGKMIKELLYFKFYYYHCYLRILELLSIEIIDSLAACRVDSIS